VNGRPKRDGNGNHGRSGIGVRLDLRHFHADAGLADVPVLSSSRALALRRIAFDRTRIPEHQSAARE